MALMDGPKATLTTSKKRTKSIGAACAIPVTLILSAELFTPQTRTTSTIADVGVDTTTKTSRHRSNHGDVPTITITAPVAASSPNGKQ